MTELQVPELDEIAGTLERGAEVVRQGWCQGISWETGFLDDDGTPVPVAFCASGALFEAEQLRGIAGHGKTSEELRRRIRYSLSLISLEGFLGVPNVPAWNDEPGRTKEEVADAMERCAKELRNGASTAPKAKQDVVVSNYHYQECQRRIREQQQLLSMEADS